MEGWAEDGHGSAFECSVSEGRMCFSVWVRLEGMLGLETKWKISRKSFNPGGFFDVDIGTYRCRRRPALGYPL